MDSTTVPPSSVSFLSSSLPSLTQFVAALAQRDERERAAQQLAQHLGVEDLVIFIRDEEIGVLLPALGFPQTFPQGRKWRSFIELVVRRHHAEGILSFPHTATLTPAYGVAFADKAVLVLLGGTPMLARVQEIVHFLPLLAAAFQGEFSTKTASTQAELARTAMEESQLVSSALELARQELQQALHQTRLALHHNEQLTEQLAGQAVELSTILETIPDAVLVCDAHGVIQRINAQGRSLFDLESGEHIQSLGPALTVFAGQRPPAFIPSVPEFLLEQAVQADRHIDLHCVLRQPHDSAEIHLLLNAVSMRPQEDVTGVVLTATDITDIHLLADMKDVFLAIASHELRTPLTTIKMMTQVARRRTERGIPVEAKHFDQIGHAVLRMERLVNDLLDVSRVQAGKLSLNSTMFDMCALCRQVAGDEQFIAEHTIVPLIPPDAISVWGDPLRITQVIVNFLANANKYSDLSSPITIELQVAETHVRLAVHDKGIGIPAISLPHIFEQFYRVPANAIQIGSGVGLGLGLFICRSIIDMHHGEIGVDSTVGQGSTFWFTLPIAPALP